MDTMEQLRQEMVRLLNGWLGPDPTERMRRIQSITHVAERSLPLLLFMAEDEVLILKVHRMPSKFLGPLEWQPAPGTIGIPRPKDAPR